VSDYPVNDLSWAVDEEFAERLERWEAAPDAPESFDATAALRRVLALADHHEECCGYVTVGSLRAAIKRP
jgi:hypothetical protein